MAKEIGMFSVRFPDECTKENAESILKEDCCHVEIHQFRTSCRGSRDFKVAIADLCMCPIHISKLRLDKRIPYWEQLLDCTPPNKTKGCCDAGSC